MKFIEGYWADEYELDRLPVEVLEDVLLRIRKDCYLSEDAADELLKIYLEARRTKLCNDFVYSEKNLKRIEEMNDLLTRQTMELAELGWNIYQENLELKRSGSEAYKPVEITLELSVPADLYYRDDAKMLVYTDREEWIWEILMSHNPKMRHQDILPSSSLHTERDNGEIQSLERWQQDLLWGSVPEEDPKVCSWGNMMTNVDHRKMEHICFVWPFHNLFDFCGLSMQDVLKIDRFNMNIKLEYDKI